MKPFRHTARSVLRRRARAAGAAVALSLALAACSSSGGGTSSRSDGGLKVGQGVSSSKIKIGMVLDESGPIAVWAGEIRAGVQAAVGKWNAAGGVHGRKIEITYLDDKGDPAQQLQDFKRLWEVDKVLAIYDGDPFSPPYAYIEQKKIPVLTYGGNAANFASKYPTFMTVGGQTSAWSAEMAYAVVHDLHRSPKTVAVTYTPDIQPVLGFIRNYWTKLGATKVIFDPDPGPTASCASLVLKYKAANVDYWDEQGPGWVSCVNAQLSLKWSPPMGQGSPYTSTASAANAIGKPLASLPGGVIAGSPTIQINGEPYGSTPSPLVQSYVSAVRKYSPKFKSDQHLNDSTEMLNYQAATLLTDILTGSASTLKALTPESVVTYGTSLRNWNSAGLGDPVVSMASDCKTGTDSTVWGVWKWNASKHALYEDLFAPTAPATHLVSNDWLGLGKCYLTTLADEYYAK